MTTRFPSRPRVPPSAVVVAVYLLVSGVTLWVWSARGMYPLIGDEPHYLVIGDALWRFGELDVVGAYQSELINRVFYPPGLGEIGAPIAEYGHVVPGERGVFSWHGYLLGWIAGLPVALIGVEAARWAMVALGGLVAAVVWVLSGNFFTSSRSRLLVSVTFVLTYPFLLASVQIFPDFVAGGLVLTGLAWLMATSRRVIIWGLFGTFVTAGAVSLLPWFGVKFAPIAALVLLAMMWRAGSRWWWVAIPAAVSAVLFGAFNFYAYGNPFGSLTGGTVEFGRDFWVRLPGLILDQSQGALMFNPILWLGLLGLVAFLRRDRLVGGVWLFTFLTLWILGAAHPGWYGGGSFIGRYSWGLALLLMPLAMVALAEVQRRSRRWFLGLLVLSWVFSIWVFTLGVFVSDAGPGVPLGLDFYTKPIDTWLESYAVLWYPLQDFVSAWYAPEWAAQFWVNYVWIALAVLMVLFGAQGLRHMSRIIVAVGVGCVALAVGVTGVLSQPGPRKVAEVQDVRVEPGAGTPGVVAGGPVWLMREGPYSWNVRYKASAPSVDAVGRWEVVRALDETVVAAGELQGTEGRQRTEVIPLAFRSLQPRQFFLRIVWNGNADFRVSETGIQHGL